MIIYQARKSEFLHDVHHRDIEEVILEAFRARTGHKVSPEEIKAWANSLGFMGKVMVDDDIPADCGVAIEYTIPQTAKRDATNNAFTGKLPPTSVQVRKYDQHGNYIGTETMTKGEADLRGAK